MACDRLKILFFSPHAAIWAHAFPEALIAETLQQMGHEIIYITCGEVFKDFCLAMRANGLAQDSPAQSKQKICDVCQAHKQVINSSFSFSKSYDLAQVVIDPIRSRITDLLANIDQENFLDFKINGLAVGRIALYELLLQHKKQNLNFIDREWSDYLLALKNTLISLFATQDILKREQPDRIITYNSLYAVNNILFKLAENQGISTYSLHSGSNISARLQTMLIGKGSTFNLSTKPPQYWHSYQDIPCDANQLKIVTAHYLQLFKGKHFLAYSTAPQPNVDVRSFFGISNHQKILVATMSSYDEIFAAEIIDEIHPDPQLIFAQQIDWIQALIKFVQANSDLFLIIRIHPREFRNNRDAVISEHGQMLQKTLTNLPDNIKVNYPIDRISLYTLADETDVFLNAWSTAGEEMTLLGLPVVTYAAGFVFYPPSLNYTAATKTAYFNQITQALADGWQFERIRKAYRWHVLKFQRGVINLSESCSLDETYIEPKNLIGISRKIYRKLISKVPPKYLRVRFQSQFRQCDQRSNTLIAQSLINQLIAENRDSILDLPQKFEPASLEQETTYIQTELRQLIDILYSQYPNEIKPKTLRQKLSDSCRSKLP